jgi:hypothetical protein
MKITLKLLPYIFIQLLILFLIGVYELFQANWDWSIFTSADFWFGYATITAATMLSFFSWANLRINSISDTPYYKNMENKPDIDLNNLGNQVAIKRNNLSTLVLEYRTSDINDFLKYKINIPEKKNKFKYNKLNKLQRLKSSFFRNIKCFSKYYDKRIATIEEQLTDEWLDSHIEYIKVRYVPVTERYIINGIDFANSGVFRKRPQSKIYKMTRDNIHRWLISLSYMLLLSSVSFMQSDKLSLQVIFVVLIKIMNCVFQSVMGASYANTYIKEKVLVELDDRIAIMEAYAEYKFKDKERSVVNG